MRPTSFQLYLDQLHQRFRDNREGAVANYIPELARVDADSFGLALVTVHGHVYQAGESRLPFTIQSISKAFVYGMALEDSGEEKVAGKIDVEPSGEAFNSISLEPHTGRPRNPMINAGAIVATSLVAGDDGPSKLSRILDKFAAYAGRRLKVDDAIYASECETGHRNRAIAHLLRNYEILEGDPEVPLDAYFQQCSMLITARDLALMGACLANDGVNPITGIRALDSKQVPRVLSVMATCGMYDYSGNWIYHVGMPAKSGVGGGIVAVLPGQFGLAVYSPRLDAKGNSARGIAVCEALSGDFGMHMLRMTRTTTTGVIRSCYSAAEIGSKLGRDTVSTHRLAREGKRAMVMELTGELTFVSAETVSNAAAVSMVDGEYLILDLSRVAAVDQSATTLLAELAEGLHKKGKFVLFTGCDSHFTFRQALRSYFHSRESFPNFEFPDIDRAVEWVEDQLLYSGQHTPSEPISVPLADQFLCRGMNEAERVFLQSLLLERQHGPGDVICREGEPAHEVYLLVRGRVSVSLQLDRKHNRRLGAFAAGWMFGESAFFQNPVRSADIIADTTVELLVLDPARLRQIDDPLARIVYLRLLENLAEMSLARLSRANAEIRALSR